MGNLIVNESNNLIPNAAAKDQALAVADSAVALAALHADTTHIEFTVGTADIRVRFDGEAPTATVGHLIPKGATGTWRKAKAAAAQFIRVGETSGVFYASEMSH